MIKKIDEIERKANTDAASQPKPTPRTRRNMQPRRYQLTHDIYAICRRNPEGAYRVQSDRLRALLLCAKALDRRKKAINLNADDIRLLVHQWHTKQLAASTIRFRLLCLRWLAKKVAKPDLVGSDKAYGVDRRKSCGI
jgi:hypothetical protein